MCSVVHCKIINTSMQCTCICAERKMSSKEREREREREREQTSTQRLPKRIQQPQMIYIDVYMYMHVCN